MWAIMKCFGYGDYPETLKVVGGTTAHGLDNVMTLDQNIQVWFDALLLWFEGIVSDNSKMSYPFRVHQH